MRLDKESSRLRRPRPVNIRGEYACATSCSRNRLAALIGAVRLCYVVTARCADSITYARPHVAAAAPAKPIML